MAQSEPNENQTRLSLSFSPVTQVKFLFDENTGEIYIYNSIKKEPLLISTNKDIKYYDIIRLMQRKGKKSIVYCGSKKIVAASAIEYSEYSEREENPSLVELAEKLQTKVHDGFWLAETVRKGIGYHMGYLPASIRNTIESSFRDTDGGLDVVFCTSTLLEGVNLPADNIFITSTSNGGEMTSLDFRNLMGRVGRIEYNLHGNVFLVHKKQSRTTLESFRNLIDKPIETQEFSFVDALDHEAKTTIVENLKAGKAGVPEIPDENDSKVLLKSAY